MAKLHKLVKDGNTIYPATTTDAVVHPLTQSTVTEMTNEYNVSVIWPTGGSNAGNKYTLGSAISKLDSALTSTEKNKGVKVIFYDENNILQEYTYLSGTFGEASSWIPTGHRVVNELNISNLYPINGEGGSNRYTLETAIAQVPSEYRTIVGLKITFVNDETEKPETWIYIDGTFETLTNWRRIPNQEEFDKLTNDVSSLNNKLYAYLEPLEPTDKTKTYWAVRITIGRDATSLLSTKQGGYPNNNSYDVPCKKGDIYYVKRSSSNNGNTLSYFATDEANIVTQSERNIEIDGDITILADGIMHFCSCQVVKKLDVSKTAIEKLEEQQEQFDSELELINVKVNQIDSMRESLSQEKDMFTEIFTEVGEKSNTITNGGVEYSAWANSCAKIVELGEILSLECKLYSYAQIVPSLWYLDENQDRISYEPKSFDRQTSVGQSPIMEFTITRESDIPTNCKYLQFQTKTDAASYNNQFIKTNSVGGESLYKITDNLRKDVDAGVMATYEYIGSLFSSILCIGDSLTEGAYGSYPQSPSVAYNIQPYNYPYYLSKLTGSRVYNAGRCGWTPKNMWDSKDDVIPVNRYFDAIYVFLGTNGGLKDTVDTDAAGDDYHSYNTSTTTGAYCALIGWLKEIYYDSKIFLINLIYGYQDDAQTNEKNGTISHIASKFGLDIIDINSKSPFTKENGNVYRPIGVEEGEINGNIHFGQLGYLTLAEYILRITGDVINNNPKYAICKNPKKVYDIPKEIYDDIALSNYGQNKMKLRYEEGANTVIDGYKSTSPIARYDEIVLQVGVDTELPTSLAEKFNGNNNLVEVLAFPVSDKCTNLNKTFYGCKYLRKIVTTGWDTSKVTNFGGFITNCSALEDIDCRNMDLSSATSFSFYGCARLKFLDLSNWSCVNVTSLAQAFALCDKLDYIDLSIANLSKCTDMLNMFYAAWDVHFVKVSSRYFFSPYRTTGIPFYGSNGCYNIGRTPDNKDNGWLAHIATVIPTVENYANYDSLPSVGNEETIYICQDTQNQYIYQNGKYELNVSANSNCKIALPNKLSEASWYAEQAAIIEGKGWTIILGA